MLKGRLEGCCCMADGATIRAVEAKYPELEAVLVEHWAAARDFSSHYRFYPSFWCKARQTLAGVAGMSKFETPALYKASITAFDIAARLPTVPASPAPFMPNGVLLVGTL